ncbi:TPA: hypothetical protein JZG68_001080 [Escherichia coli]|nr:hypothetical protein [Escherichia coli]
MPKEDPQNKMNSPAHTKCDFLLEDFLSGHATKKRGRPSFAYLEKIKEKSHKNGS